jgi:hypothetical protein
MGVVSDNAPRLRSPEPRTAPIMPTSLGIILPLRRARQAELA